MEGTTTAAAQETAATPQAAVSNETLLRIQALLEQQVEQNKKLLRASKWRTIFLVILVGVFVTMGIVFYGILTQITQQIPGLIAQTDELIVNANSAVKNANSAVTTVVDKIDSLNIEALNESIEGISSIDYEGLNVSIGGLAAGVEKFQKFTDALSRPMAGLFG